MEGGGLSEEYLDCWEQSGEGGDCTPVCEGFPPGAE